MTEQRLALGDLGEKLAVSHLKRQGYRILTTRYRVRLGEIDIVAEDNGTLVFIEVKTRRGLAAGHPFEAVTPKKQLQLSRVALEYMSRHGCRNRPARFDVVGVLLADRMAPGAARLEVVRNAFDLCYGV